MTYAVAVFLMTSGAIGVSAVTVEGSYKPQMKVWPTVLASLVVWGVGVWLGG